jgi:hypothetical protein
VTVRPGQRDLQLEYTALTYLEPNNVRFRYKLEGYDADWVDAGGRRTAFYTQVRPRRYTFLVQAADGEGGWHEPGAALEMQVIPRVYGDALVQVVGGRDRRACADGHCSLAWLDARTSRP